MTPGECAVWAAAFAEAASRWSDPLEAAMAARAAVLKLRLAAVQLEELRRQGGPVVLDRRSVDASNITEALAMLEEMSA